MSMTMSMGSSTTGTMPAMSTSTGMSGMNGMSGMGGGSGMMMMMTMTFFQATDTPLYSMGWTPHSTGAYAGTCIFLILLATVFRALFAFKSILEGFWARKASQRRFIVIEDDNDSARDGDAASNPRVRDGPNAATTGFAEKSTMAVLTTRGLNERVRIIESPSLAGPGKSYQPWRLSVDFPRALIVAILVSIGYLLMLAVMTYNIGYFLSVISGSFLGELLVGRFHNGTPHHDH